MPNKCDDLIAVIRISCVKAHRNRIGRHERTKTKQSALTLSSMIHSKVTNRRSNVTKRQNVRRTSEMHFFFSSSYESTRACSGVELLAPKTPVTRESALLLHRLSMAALAATGLRGVNRGQHTRWLCCPSHDCICTHITISAGTFHTDTIMSPISPRKPPNLLVDIDSQLCFGTFHSSCRNTKDSVVL